MVSERIEEEVPPEYAQLLGITTLVCTPLSAGGYAYRGDLRRPRRRAVRPLRRRAAPAVDARQDRGAGRGGAQRHARPQERTRRLGERLDLAREIHESVLQRLFGVSLALGAEQPVDRAERERCRIEMQEALADLRRALERPLAPITPRRRARRSRPSSSGYGRSPGMFVEVDWRGESNVPADLEPLAQSVLAEALRNIAKHADPTRVEVAVARDQDTFTLEVRNDGARLGRGRPGDGPAARRVRGAPAGRGGRVRAVRRGSVATYDSLLPLPAGLRVVDDRRLRVLVVDDHDVVHWGFRVLLGEQPWVERFFQARTGAEALGAGQGPQAPRGARRPVPGRGVGGRALRARFARRRQPRACC